MERGAIPDSTGPEPGSESEASGCAAARESDPAVTLLICTTCRVPGVEAAPDAERDGARLLASASALSAPDGVAVEGVAVVGVSCLANCKRALSAAMVRHGGWTYVFGDLAPDSAPDLLTGAALLAGSQDGLMPWRGRPDALKRGMVARIPPLTLKETR